MAIHPQPDDRVQNDINVGAPQGSCLGPLLFLVYTNDPPCSMYADDTSIYHSFKDIAQLNAVLNEELRRLDRWLKGNKLSLNVAKTRSTNSQFDAPSKPLIQSLGWKTTQELINGQVNLTVYKCLNSIAPKYLCDIFTKNTVNATRSLRNTNTNGQKCFSFRGAKCWNGVSTEAKQTTSIKAFKCLI